MKRVAPWTVVAVVAMLTAFASVMPDEDWPFAAIVSAGLVLTFATACGALIASRRPDNAVGWIRYRRSSGAERVQLRWFSYAVVTAVVLFLTSPLYFLLVVRTDDYIVLEWLGFIFPLIGSVLIPSSIALAILRYRLYDIDRIISRTVGYAIVTAALAGLFAFVALTPTTFLGAAEAPEWLIAAGTLAVVALFRPVRRRVQDAVDRRFNRARYDAARTIETFATRLRGQVDLDDLRQALEATVRQTMQPESAQVWLRRRS